MSAPVRDTEYEGPIQSILRLFLSVDLVGSTAFKQANQRAFKSDEKAGEGSIAEPWFSPIAQFYKEIERLFAREWQLYAEGLASRIGWPAGPAPELWKSAGDELLYVKVLRDHREATACIICWMRTIEEYRSDLKQKYPTLDLKCTAWVAGFPIANTEVVFAKRVDNEEIPDDADPLFANLDLLHRYDADPNDRALTKDYIGPSVDTGFRLCELSTARKFVISVDLALMVVHAVRARPAGADEIDVKLHYDGRVGLKGVLGGHPYPVFWIDMASDSSLDKLEDKLLEIQPRNTDDIKSYCEEFFNSHSSNAMIPYIVGNQDPYFASMPESHAKKIKLLRDYWENERSRRDQERESSKAEGPGEEPGKEQVEGLFASLLRLIVENTPDRPTK
ncbi:hypothetical protein Rleg2_3867 [Rhizobium leguminosarum bv. trifolii WSM2304]|uniref:Uncharacterized protein n=1 Tax=Rhizobium leguminosarum bv. trifolii (strain WSM2304) TaxID=395492 RepID=A0ABF7QSW9_RHILW|nr:hypothetical protein [Rhizobium leguminosarum]ACI57129.1 hypothetical protein Rleg2_3867 [Rhizobium leguminosarum bv. trifolii WSM2304]